MAKKIPKLGGDSKSSKGALPDKTSGGDINTAISDFNSRTLIGQKRLDQFRQVVIQAMFKLMKDAGIDPNDLNSIQKFLQSLEEMDPDIAQLFDVAFNDMIGSDQTQQPTSPDQSSSFMDQYSNLAGSAMGQGQGPDMSGGAGMPQQGMPDMSGGAGMPPTGAPDMGGGGSMSPNQQIPTVGNPWIGGTPMVPPQ
jgi:hypothetical protein